MGSLNSSGDTIVEVLLAIAIVSSVLSGAFVSANHSLSGSRLSQERSEALKLAEGQVEQLQALNKDPNIDLFDTAAGTLYCISDGQMKRPASSTLPELQMDDFTNYHADCQNQSLRYNLSIQYDPGNHNTFAIRARWDGLRGDKQEVKILYRVHEKTQITVSPPPPPPPPPPPAPNCVVSPSSIPIPEVVPPGEPISESHLYFAARDPRLTYTKNISAQTSSMTNGCRFRVFVTTRDPEHPGGDQPNERLYVTFALRNGGSFDTRVMTDDLPRGLKSTTTDLGVYTFSSPPVSVVFKHYYLWTGDRSSTNSVDPAAIRFEAVP